MKRRKDVIRREWAKKVQHYDDYGIVIVYFDYPEKVDDPSTIRGEIYLWTEDEACADFEILGFLPEDTEEIPAKAKREMYKLAEYFEAEEFDCFKGRVEVHDKIQPI